MWCSFCHQDVPSAPHPTNGRRVCSRCQHPLRSPKPAYAAKICDDGIALDDPAAAMAAAAPPLGGFDRHARERARDLGRELRRPGIGTAAANTSMPQKFLHTARRFHAPENLFADLAAATAPAFAPIAIESSRPGTEQQRRSDGSQIIAWFVIVAGVVLLAGGLGIISWSLSTQEMAHWNLALGLTLGGQGVLIFGLVLVVSRLWRASRHASSKLRDVHARLGQLQHAADALTAKNSGGAPAFYADLVRGASPQVLLANLKGQVDQLATRLGSGL